jgi:RNA polymerase sigma-70 factor (ECF subfamily)
MPHQAVADEQLMLELRGGAHGAFETLFERYRAAVWGFFRRRVPDPARAEELTHDVFVALLENAPRYHPAAPFRSYLFGIAYNLLLAERRRTPPSSAAAASADLPATVVNLDAGIWVRRALATLEPDVQEIVMLREYEQLGYQEIADLLQLPLNTVRSRLFRARMALKDALTAGAPALARPPKHERRA